MLDEVVEVLAETLVVQIILDNASAYKIVGRLFMEKIKYFYWTSCVAHCVHLMLERL